MNIAGGEDIVPYIAHPLFLVGLGLVLAYGVYSRRMRSRFLSRSRRKNRNLIVRPFFYRGFWLALLLLLGALTSQVSKVVMSTQQGVVKEGNIRSVNAGAIAAQLYEQLYKEGHQLDVKNEQVKSLTEAVTALSNLSKADASIEGINNALASLERGKTKQARSLFAGLLKRRIPKDQRGNKDAAALARHLGALAFLNDTQAALVAYRKAVQLDPDNAESWSRLGQVLYRTGQLDQAEEMYRNALEFNNALGCMGGMAKAITGLGNVAFTRSELDQAEQMYKKALEIDKALGLKAAMAQDYSSLGNVAFSRGDLDLAEERYKKGLVLDELFRTKENIAKTYDNLGRVYKARGELDKAEQMRRKAATLDDSYAMGNQFAQAEN